MRCETKMSQDGGLQYVLCGAVPPKDATQLNQTVLLSRVVEVVTPKDATQQNCFVEMSRVVAVVTPKDATQQNCLIESGLSV